MPPVGVLIKPASGSCNMHCDYCFYKDETENRSQASFGLMSDATLKNVIRKTLLPTEGMYSIAFQGGEPTLCGPDFFERVIKYIGQYNRNNVRIHLALQTNGYGINEEWAEFFARNNFLLGISVDGTEEIHNKYRHGNDGGDSYAHALDAIRLFEEHDVEYNVLTVVHREIAENIAEIYRAYRERGWDYMQFITCLDPIGEMRGRREYSLLPETYGSFLITLFDLWYEDLKRGNRPFIRQFENYVGILLGYPPESCEQRGFCDIQNVVEADGSVYPCDFYVLDEYRLGNLNEDRLQEIYKRRDEIDFVSRSKKYNLKCRECKWFSLCRGGCYRSRMTEHDPEGISYFCKGYEMFFERCYDKLLDAAKIYGGHR